MNIFNLKKKKNEEMNEMEKKRIKVKNEGWKIYKISWILVNSLQRKKFWHFFEKKIQK